MTELEQKILQEAYDEPEYHEIFIEGHTSRKFQVILSLLDRGYLTYVDKPQYDEYLFAITPQGTLVLLTEKVQELPFEIDRE